MTTLPSSFLWRMRGKMFNQSFVEMSESFDSPPSLQMELLMKNFAKLTGGFHGLTTSPPPIRPKEFSRIISHFELRFVFFQTATVFTKTVFIDSAKNHSMSIWDSLYLKIFTTEIYLNEKLHPKRSLFKNLYNGNLLTTFSWEVASTEVTFRT